MSCQTAPCNDNPELNLSQNLLNEKNNNENKPLNKIDLNPN
jgi:hypothetical protein